MMEKNSQIHISPATLLLFKEGIVSAGVERKYGIKTYEALKAVIDAGEYIIEGQIPLQTESDL